MAVLACTALATLALATGAEAFVVTAAGTQAPLTVRPGDPEVALFQLTLQNSVSPLADTLRTLTFTNQTTGAGGVPERDLELGTLHLRRDNGDGILQLALDPVVATVTASGGRVRFTGLHVAIPALGSASVFLTSDVSLLARDGDQLDASVAASADIVIAMGVIGGTFPIAPAGSFPVDGMSAAQIALGPLPATALAGTDGNLVLDLRVPPNGYTTDVLQRLDVVNLGTAQPGTDIAAMRLLVDDGDGQFEPAADRLVGQMVESGGHWLITGFSEPIPLAGLRLFVAADLALFATNGRTLRFMLPTLPDPGVLVASTNDGPVDATVAPAAAIVISTADRVTLTAVPIAPAGARPGATQQTVLHVIAGNAYTAPRTLQTLRVRNTTVGTGTSLELDRELDRATLRLDGNGDGVLDPPAIDPILGSAFFSAGVAEITGLSWTLPAGATRHAFVTVDVATAGAADSDSLSVSVSGPLDVAFTTPTTVAALWPLDSRARVGVDGMVAAQVGLQATSGSTLGPDEGPALALGVVVPANGYRPDSLRRVRVTNLGSATHFDLAGVRLWRDGGDHAFQAGGDDRDLGALTWNGSAWQSATLSEPLPVGGALLWVAVTIGSTPSDSVTLRLAIPLGGLDVSSGDDGPLDAPTGFGTTLLVSNAPLIVTLDVTPLQSVVGQTVRARALVRNRSAERIHGIVPTLTATGTGTLTPSSGPTPPTLDLAPAATDSFTWMLDASAPGGVQLWSQAQGTGDSTGAPRGSLLAGSAVHSVYAAAGSLDVGISAALPAAVRRGQTRVVPFALVAANRGAAGSAPIRVESLTLRIEDGAGAGIVPSSLLTRVTVESGSTTLALHDTVESSGATVSLTLSPAPIIAAGDSLSLVTRIDVTDSTPVASFRVALQDSGAIAASEAPTSRPLPLRLAGGLAFPVRTAVARVVASATELTLSALPAGAARAARGQADVPLLSFALGNPGTDGVTSDVRVFSFPLVLADTSGTPHAPMSDVLERLRVRSGALTLAIRTVYPADDSVVVVTLASPVTVPTNTPITLDVFGDVAPAAPLGVVRMHVGDPLAVDARDVATGEPIPARLLDTPLAGSTVQVEAVADTLRALGTPRFAARTRIGDAGVVALTVVLRHPGAPGVGRIRLDSLVVLSRDDRHADLAPGTVLDAIAVRRGGVEIARQTALASTGGRTPIALPGILLEAGESDTLDLVADIDANAPETFLELSIAGTGIAAADANRGLAVVVAAEPGAELPLFSGLTRLEPPARELRADLEDRMPVALAPDGRWVSAGILRLRNVAGAGRDTIRVEHIVLLARDRDLAPVPIGAGAAALELWANGAAVAAGAPLTPDSITATLSGGSPLAVPPGETVALELRLRTPLAPGLATMRLGVDSASVGVVQPSSALLRIEVRPEPGRSFPQWTGAAAFGAMTLAGSLSNYPNPFAPGREATRFVYFLRADARVTLRLVTLQGDLVRVPLDRGARAAGLHQDDAWDGENGAAQRVRNGVYLAELVAEYDDGTRERVVRKVAVRR